MVPSPGSPAQHLVIASTVSSEALRPSGRVASIPRPTVAGCRKLKRFPARCIENSARKERCCTIEAGVRGGRLFPWNMWYNTVEQVLRIPTKCLWPPELRTIFVRGIRGNMNTCSLKKRGNICLTPVDSGVNVASFSRRHQQRRNTVANATQNEVRRRSRDLWDVPVVVLTCASKLILETEVRTNTDTQNLEGLIACACLP